MPFPVELEHVTRTESALGVSFPASFVERMRRMNGGEVLAAGDSWTLFPFADTSDRTRIKRTASDIVRETKGARDCPDFPQTGVAIASNGMGDYLLLLPDATEPGVLSPVVSSWSHETGEMEEVASDFAALTA